MAAQRAEAVCADPGLLWKEVASTANEISLTLYGGGSRRAARLEESRLGRVVDEFIGRWNVRLVMTVLQAALPAAGQ